MYYKTRKIVPQINCMGKKRIHILIGVSKWTTKERSYSYLSRLKRWYSVNKSNKQSIYITEEGTQS